MASAGWDEVLGSDGDGVGDGGAGDGGDGDGGDEGGPPPKKKKRVPTSTKILLVVGAWLLLTLFLVGQFKSDKATPSGVANLDTVAGEDGVVEPEPVDTAEEEALDTNGDGFLSAEEQGIAAGGASAADGSALGSGAGGSSSEAPAYEATPSGSGSTTGSPNAVPGAPPTTSASGGSTSATTTTTGGGSGGGGGSSTTTTTKPGTTTTTNGGGGGTTTTSTTPSPSPVTVLVTAKNVAYVYPSGYSKDFTVAAGSKIKFDNQESNNGIKHSFTIPLVWDSGQITEKDGTKTSPELQAGTYAYGCTVHPTTMNGTITVT